METISLGDDRDVILVGTYPHIPTPIYFFPVISFLIMLYFALIGMYVHTGYYYALFGTSITSVVVITVIVVLGLATDRWYYIASKTKTIIGETIIAIIGLISMNITFYVMRYQEQWYPTLDILLWFIYGFAVYQVIEWIFKKYYYTEATKRTKRANIIIGLILGVAIGIAGIYFSIGAGFYYY